MATRKKFPTKQRVYSKIVAFFLLLTIAAIFVIVHFALAQATIKINSATEISNYSGLVELLPENSQTATTENILGKMLSQEIELTVTAPSETIAGTTAKAGGYVTIINNYSKSQPLVKTTRLLTADGKLYRIQEGVTVPAGGQVKIWAEADQEGEQFVIGPTKLTIPGLWEGLQDKIFAEAEGFALASLPTYKVTEAVLEQARQELQTQAINQSLTAFNALLPENLQLTASQIFANYETLESTPVGTEAEFATLKQKAKIYGLVFSPADLLQITENKFSADLQSNEKIVSIIPESFQYGILEIYPEKEQAVIEVRLDANVSSNQYLLKIDKNDLIGKSEMEVKEYLQQFNIESSEIKFFPFWIKTVPKLKDHIIIE